MSFERDTSAAAESAHNLFRCNSCGDFLECRRCICARHSRIPLHFLEVWRGDYFERTTLHELGLVYQVGHGGAPCPNPDKTPRLMTVVHTTGIHTVAFRYCDCIWADRQLRWQQLFRTAWYPATTHTPQTCATIEVLDLYRRLKVMATVNVRDFVSCLENLTDAWGTEWTPDRYKAFARMARQWALLMRVRWAGVAFEVGGLSNAAWGSVAVECWACPRVGVNLPVGWENVDEEHRYRFRRIVSNDANFRFLEKMRVMAHPDPPLYSGLGVQVPVELYHEWLKTHITEEEVTCRCPPVFRSFAALMQKDTRFSVGLRWSGVIGVICARHEVMLGLGDLEKGER
ncbi:hypothetical protein BDZ89DRAFT_946871 [Hymenopellis radicata]|nr:hypothetical protein BDZ89DRAFT_946871 [Hymenopellis radicata]